MAVGKVTPWSYRKGSTLLHRLPAGFKLAFLFLLSLAAFFPGSEARSLVILSCIALILIVLSFVAGIGPLALLRGSGPLLFVVLAVFLIQGVEISPLGFNLEGLWESVIFCVRIGTAFSAGTLLFSVTTTGEIKKSLSHLEAALGLEKLKLSLCLSLMLGFLPRFFETWEDLNLAWKSRGGKNSLKRLITLIPLVIEKMMVKAAEIALALESRGAGNS
jgi:biotin transport system permease protein